MTHFHPETTLNEGARVNLLPCCTLATMLHFFARALNKKCFDLPINLWNTYPSIRAHIYDVASGLIHLPNNRASRRTGHRVWCMMAHQRRSFGRDPNPTSFPSSLPTAISAQASSTMVRLITHNLLACHVKGCTTNNFPLAFRHVELEIREAEFNPDFVRGFLPKIEWGALVDAARQVSFRLPLDMGGGLTGL